MANGGGKPFGGISLSEGESKGIQITVEDVEESAQRGVNCLVGRYWTEKKYNKEAFKTVLSKLWRVVGRVTFRELHDNLWLFEFSDGEDKRRVMEGRPWSFDRQILVIREFDGQTPPAQMTLNSSVFWVQIHDMPLACMTKSVGIKIGESIGELEDIEIEEDGIGWGRYLRIRVNVDITKPLERGRALQLGGKSIWVNFKYEKLPNFCFYCGCILHGNKGCGGIRSTRRPSTAGEKPWGTRLRAEEAGTKMGSGFTEQGQGDGDSQPFGEQSHGGARHQSPEPGLEKGGTSGKPRDSSTAYTEDISEDSTTFHKEKFPFSGYGSKKSAQKGNDPKVKRSNGSGAGENKVTQQSSGGTHGGPNKTQKGFDTTMPKPKLTEPGKKGKQEKETAIQNKTSLSPLMGESSGSNLKAWKRKARAINSQEDLEDTQDVNKRKFSHSGLENMSGAGAKKGRLTEETHSIVLAEAAMQPRHTQ